VELLEGAHATRRLGDPRHQHRIARRFGVQRVRRLPLVLLVVAEQQHVAAGAHRSHRRGADADVIGDRAHVEIVGDDHPAIAEALAQ
jgi:hypothetical protein